MFGVVFGLGLRLLLEYTVRPILKHLLVHRTEQMIKERRERLMEKVNNQPIRDSIASKQRQLRVEQLRILAGEDPGTPSSAEAIAAEMRSLANDAVKELIGHLDTVARTYRGVLGLSLIHI